MGCVAYNSCFEGPCFEGWGMMMLRSMQLRLAVGLLAAGLLSLSIASAWAFTRENVSPDGGNYSFTDPDQKLTDPGNRNSDQGTKPFGSTGPVVQFGVQQGPLTGRSNSAPPADPYFRSLQMGN
jgi:hypothetical protein